MAVKLSRHGLMNVRTAVFRVDAGPGIGMGHFMRCRTLAFELISRGWDVYFAGCGLPADMLEQTPGNPAKTIKLIDLQSFLNSKSDAMSFYSLLTGQFNGLVDCAVIDTYSYSRDDFALFQRFNTQRLPIIVIDDLADRDTPAQIVINPNPLFEPLPYERQKIPLILCGHEYTLVRPEISRLVGRPYRHDGPVMVSLGGGDVVDYLLKVLDAIPDDLENSLCVSVSDNCPRAKLEAWVAQNPTRRYLNFDSRKFPELLASAALAITGGGTTLWEVYALGMPSLCLRWVENQRQTSSVIKEQATSFLMDIVSHFNINLHSEWLGGSLKTIAETVGLPANSRVLQQQEFCVDELISRSQTSLGIGNSDLIDSAFIAAMLRRCCHEPEFWRQMIERQQALIDGRGVSRCVDAIEKFTWREVPLFEADWRRNYENW